MGTLKVIHNAGFFSCCSIRLQDIIVYFNQNKGLPDHVDSSEQWELYKYGKKEDLTSKYFIPEREDINIPYEREMVWTNEQAIMPQFSDYGKFHFEDIKPFVDKYFTPSGYVSSLVLNYEQRYNLDYSNLCAVFYRGNDKNRETLIASYNHFIDKAREVKAQNPEVRFLVQPDETEFLEAFLKEFPDSIHFNETPHIRKQDSAVFYEMPQSQRAQYAAYFLGAVLCLSKCKHLIVHSGNCAQWAVMYRGNMDNVHQILNNVWL